VSENSTSYSDLFYPRAHGRNFLQGPVPEKAPCGKCKILTDHISLFALAAKKLESDL
jgi:hypothetical protein